MRLLKNQAIQVLFALVIGMLVALAIAPAVDEANAVTFNMRADYVSIGADATATKVDLLKVGTIDVDNGATSKTLTITGLAVGDTAVVTPNETIASAAKFWATCTTNTLTVFVNADPGTTVTFHYLVLSAFP